MSRGIGGRTGQKGSQYGNGWRRWRFLTVEAAGNAQGEGVQNPSGEPVARPRPQYCARVVKIAGTGVFGRPCVVPVGVGRVDVLGAGVCAYRRAGARDDWPPFLQAKQGNFRRIYSTSGNGDISHGNGPILDVPGKYEGLHAQRVTRPKYGVFSKNNYPRKQGVFPCANGWPFQSRPGS